jgi:hypothetical protein
MLPQSGSEGRRALEVVVCLDGALVDVIHQRHAGVLTLGDSPGCTIAYASSALVPGQPFVLTVRHESGTTLVASALPGQAEPPSPTLRELAPGESVWLMAGPLSLNVRDISDTAPAPRAPLRVDRPFVAVLGATTVATLAFLAVLFAIPPDARAYIPWLPPDTIRRVHLEQIPTEDPVPEPAAAASGDVAISASEPTRSVLTHIPKAKGGGETPPPSRDQAGAYVASRGLLSVLRQSALSDLTSDREAWPAADALGYGPTASLGPGDGNHGFGTDLTGYGGPGSGGCPPGHYCGPSSVLSRGPGIGPPGPIPGYGRTRGLGLKTRTASPPQVHIGPPEVKADGLDRAIVRRVVREHLDEIRHCYEKALAIGHAVDGTVAVEFLILPRGAVSGLSLDSSLGAPAVEDCIKESISGWVFPASPHITKVVYPFSFRRAGEDASP